MGWHSFAFIRIHSIKKPLAEHEMTRLRPHARTYPSVEESDDDTDYLDIDIDSDYDNNSDYYLDDDPLASGR